MIPDEEFQSKIKTAIFIFILVSAFTGFIAGVTDLILSNYFKEAYDATAQQRGLIEVPREVPGIVSLFIIAAFSFLRDIRTAVIAQIFGVIGLVGLGLFHPSFGVMLVFLFLFSLGQHMFIPLGDSIGLSLTNKDNMGRILGRFKSVSMAFMMVAGLVCFFGFRSGVFHFNTPVTIFLICAGAFGMCIVLLLVMRAKVGMEMESRTKASKMIFRKEYMRYYVISAIYGSRRQIMFAFSPWVLIELLGFKADAMSILGVIGAFIGIFFIPYIGKLNDRFGSRMVMMVEALCFIALYVIYGLLSKWVNEQTIVITAAVLFFVYVLFICDRMTTQFYMVRALYLKSIAVREEDVTPSLSTGMALDHVFAIICALISGVIWDRYGPEYVFIFAAILSAANFVVAFGVKKDSVIDRTVK